MTKKRMALIAVLPLTVAVMIGALATFPPRSDIKAKFDRIEKGMTAEDVAEIFGKQGVVEPVLYWSFGHTEYWSSWRDDDGSTARMRFCHNNNGEGSATVYRKEWQESPETALDKFCRWLHID